jgi:hypothetical protein
MPDIRPILLPEAMVRAQPASCKRRGRRQVSIG